MLKVSKLHHRFGDQVALADINFEITQPKLFVFAGANGSGKSTLFNCINGLLIPDEGTVEINRDEIGLVCEPFNTEGNLTVMQILHVAASIKNTSVDEIQQWLHFWEMDKQIDKCFKALSVGMRKRLAIISSLIGNPSLLLWDEPFNGLDPLGMDKLRQLISQLLSEGKTICLSTHIIGELGDDEAQIIILKNGQIANELTSSELKDDKTDILELLNA